MNYNNEKDLLKKINKQRLDRLDKAIENCEKTLAELQELRREIINRYDLNKV